MILWGSRKPCINCFLSEGTGDIFIHWKICRGKKASDHLTEDLKEFEGVFDVICGPKHTPKNSRLNNKK